MIKVPPAEKYLKIKIESFERANKWQYEVLYFEDFTKVLLKINLIVRILNHTETVLLKLQDLLSQNKILFSVKIRETVI